MPIAVDPLCNPIGAPELAACVVHETLEESSSLALSRAVGATTTGVGVGGGRRRAEYEGFFLTRSWTIPSDAPRRATPRGFCYRRAVLAMERLTNAR